MSAYTVVWLEGDYAGKHDRQRQAVKAKCSLVLDLHFNSSDSPAARGGEFWHKPGDRVGYLLALRFKQELANLGLPTRPEAVLAVRAKDRASYIAAYAMPVVLLEPAFVSNPDQAWWLHQPGNIIRLGQALAWAVKSALPGGGVVGTSVGHVHKPSAPHDRGAECVGAPGCDEATHSVELAHVIAGALEG